MEVAHLESQARSRGLNVKKADLKTIVALLIKDDVKKVRHKQYCLMSVFHMRNLIQ